MYNEENLRTLRNRIIGCRLRVGLTQAELAKKSDISLRAIQMWESAKGAPTANNLRKLAQALETDTDYLLGKSEETPIKEAALRPLEIELLRRLQQLNDKELSRVMPGIFMAVDDALIKEKDVEWTPRVVAALREIYGDSIAEARALVEAAEKQRTAKSRDSK